MHGARALAVESERESPTSNFSGIMEFSVRQKELDQFIEGTISRWSKLNHIIFAYTV